MAAVFWAEGSGALGLAAWLAAWLCAWMCRGSPLGLAVGGPASEPASMGWLAYACWPIMGDGWRLLTEQQHRMPKVWCQAGVMM